MIDYTSEYHLLSSDSVLEHSLFNLQNCGGEAKQLGFTGR